MSSNKEIINLASIERKLNPAVIENNHFGFLTDEDIEAANMFSKCKRVHIKGCSIMFLKFAGELVAFVEPKE